ncbi:MAG: carboxypeptidase-like regulatory domain-containing protein [bacterium]
MSESIPIAKPIAKRSPRTSRGSTKKSTTVITNVMTLLTTVAVSFIAIVPQLRRGDAETIDKLKQGFSAIEQQNKSAMNIPIGSDKKLSVIGTVRNESGVRTLAGVEVYLLPEGNNLLTAKTDDSGKFTFKQIPAGTYSIIVRDSTLGKAGKGLLDESENEIKVIGATVKYHIQH